MRERSRVEGRALGMGDCNFTHGVTHRSATLHLSAYALRCEAFRDIHSSIPLRRSVSPRHAFCFRLLNVRLQPHAMEYPLLLLLSPYLFLTHLFILVLSSSPPVTFRVS